MRRLLAAALVVAALVAASCGGAPPEAPRPGASAPASAPAGADVALVQERLHLGRTVPGGYLEGALPLRAGAQGAVLTQVAPSCGCTISLTETPVSLRPNEVFEAPLALDLSRLTDLGAPTDGPRTIERAVAIASESGTRLTAMVAAEVSDRVVVQPAQARFATIHPGSRAVGELTVSGAAGRPAPAIERVEVDHPDVSTSLVPGSDGATLLRLTWSPAAAGALETWAVLHFEDGAEQRIPLRVTGTCEALVTAEPARIENLAAPITKPVVVRVTLRRTDDRPLGILGTESTNHRVEVRVDDAAAGSPTRTLRILVPVLALPQEIRGEVVVRTDASGAETVRIPVHVRAQG